MFMRERSSYNRIILHENQTTVYNKKHVISSMVI